MSNDIVGYCGLICTECAAYRATQEDNNNKRKEVAHYWNTQYKFELKYEDINCDGCLQTGKRLMKYCSSCEVRRCGLQRDIINCAYCGEYPCQKLTSMAWFNTESKPTLDQIQESLRSQIHYTENSNSA